MGETNHLSVAIGPNECNSIMHANHQIQSAVAQSCCLGCLCKWVLEVAFENLMVVTRL